MMETFLAVLTILAGFAIGATLAYVVVILALVLLYRKVFR